MNSTKHCNRRAFSLIELLIVIGIIALLLAILLPVLAQVRQRAEKARCASNLRQVGAGLEMYNQVNRHLPLTTSAAALADVMKGLDIDGIMTCPMDQSGGYSYAMNGAYAGLPKTAGDPTDVLASESVARHDGKANVVYFDGHVEEK